MSVTVVVGNPKPASRTLHSCASTLRLITITVKLIQLAFAMPQVSATLCAVRASTRFLECCRA